MSAGRTANGTFQGGAGLPAPFFTCPNCGGSWFHTTDLRSLRPHQHVACKDRDGKGCRWTGYFDHDSETYVPAPLAGDEDR